MQIIVDEQKRLRFTSEAAKWQQLLLLWQLQQCRCLRRFSAASTTVPLLLCLTLQLAP